ncbi:MULTISPECIES: MFS transporter [Corynebacterium]|uniref:MFS transporter n=1 Tax=Corynebacterium TaxID=1716 RepID=UPI0018832318|nr:MULTISPECIES: MFS transporter [Corynebacterium]MBF0581348.1 MFS transporter [Corynebacterium sp. ED61]
MNQSSTKHVATSSQEPHTTTRSSDRKSLAASMVGQLLEWFEWSTYAVFAPFIAAAMFNSADPSSALLATFGVLAIGFFVRPLGGIVFGIIADRKGRKFVLMTTIFTMAAAAVIIGFMPTYEKIGVWASVGLLLLRLIQGFAHGGESATANAYIPEIAPKQHRGLWSSFVYMSIFGGSVLAYIVGGVISSVLTEDQVGSWGWRIPFWLGAIAALFAMFMRRGMNESEAFTESEKHNTNTAKPVVAADHNSPGETGQKAAPIWVSILLVVGMVSGITAAHYTWSSYVSTYAIKHEGMAVEGAYWVTVVAQVIGLIALPLWGRLSDRIGRKPVIYFFAGALAIAQVPLMNFINSQPWTLLVASGASLIIVSAGGALLGAIMSEVFPTAHRTKSIGLAYSLSVAVFGGTAPYVFQLMNNLDLAWISGSYVVILCILTLVCMRLLPETRGIDLKH